MSDDYSELPISLLLLRYNDLVTSPIGIALGSRQMTNFKTQWLGVKYLRKLESSIRAHKEGLRAEATRSNTKKGTDMARVTVTEKKAEKAPASAAAVKLNKTREIDAKHGGNGGVEPNGKAAKGKRPPPPQGKRVESDVFGPTLDGSNRQRAARALEKAEGKMIKFAALVAATYPEGDGSASALNMVIKGLTSQIAKAGTKYEIRREGRGEDATIGLFKAT